MRLKHLAVCVAIALFPTVASAQLVTVHSDGVSGDFDNLYDARDALLVDPATPGIIEILDEGPFIGPAVTFNDTPVDGVQPYNLTDITIRGAEGVKPILASTAASSVLTFNYVYGNITIENLILTGAVPNESTGVTTGPQRAITYAGLPGGPSIIAAHTASGRPLNILIDDVVITSSYLTFTGEGENQVIDQIIPATLDGITVAGINAPAPEGELATFRFEALNISSTSPTLVNSLEMRNSVMSALPRVPYGFRTFFDGGPGTEIIVGPNIVASYLTGPRQGANQIAAALQVGGNDGTLHMLKVRGTPEQPIILHGNHRGVDITGNTPVGAIKSFENVIISDSLYEGFRTFHPTENYILNNVTIANSGQDDLDFAAEPFIFGNWGENGDWQGSLVATNTIIAGDGSEDFRNLISVGSTAEPPGFAEFTDSAIVLNGAFKLNTTDHDQDGFDGLFPSDVTLNNVINGDPEFISTTLSEATLADFYRAGSAAYDSAGIAGGYGETEAVAPDYVTVHSDGVSGDFDTIQAAINAVQGNPTGVGVVEILDEGPFVQGLMTIPGGQLDEFTLRGAPGVRPIIASSAGSSVLHVDNFYGKVVMENLLMTSATENGPVRAVRFVSTVANHNNAGTPIDYLMDDVIITPSWRTADDPPVFIPITLDGVNFVPDPGNGAVFCNIRQVAILGDSNSASIVSRKEFRNLVISGFPGMDWGIRSFFDGGEGTELVVGPNVVISYLTGPAASASALQIGGNDSAMHILKVHGTPEEPVFLHGNTRGVFTSGSTPVGAIKSFRNVFITDSLQEAFVAGHPTENYTFDNVTIANSGQDGGADPAEVFRFNGDSWDGSLTANGVIFAGNGSSDARNVIRTMTDAGGTASISDSGVVLSGPFSLTGDGFAAPDPTNVTLSSVINGDPQFISTTFGDEDFYRPGNPAYADLGGYGVPAIPPAFATVHSDGVTGDFDTIQAAINSVMGSDGNVGIVEILDEGPFVQGLITIPGGQLQEFTLRGAEGVRPIIATSAGSSVLHVDNFYGKVVMENLLMTSATENGPVRAVRFVSTVPNHNAAGTPIDYLMDDVIITPSWRTADDPPVFIPITLDGVNFVPDPGNGAVFCNIRQVAILGDSNSPTIVSRKEFRNIVISGFPGMDWGIRSFFDGGDGTELVVGPNVVISYLTGPAAAASALQIGGNDDGTHILRVHGTPEEPVFLHGNTRGVFTSGSTPVGAIKSFRNVFITDSLQEAFVAGHPTENYTFDNVTIANSGQDGGADPAEVFRFNGDSWNGSLTANGVIFAGNGSSDARNVIRTMTDSGGTAAISNSGVVLNGPFSLTGDGFAAPDPTNVTLDSVIDSDPQFISTTFGDADFYRPGNPAYEDLGGYAESALVPPMLGDINGDGVVNVADVTALASAIAAGEEDELDPAVADINNDGNIDADDVAALAEMIVN